MPTLCRIGVSPVFQFDPELCVIHVDNHNIFNAVGLGIVFDVVGYDRISVEYFHDRSAAAQL